MKHNNIVWLFFIILSLFLHFLKPWTIPLYIDFLFIFLVLWSVRFGYASGAVLGCILGFLEDGISNVNLGVNACSKAATAALAGLAPKIFYPKAGAFLILGFFLSIVKDLIVMAASHRVVGLFEISIGAGGNALFVCGFYLLLVHGLRLLSFHY